MSIKKIAEKAGLSKTTVSMILNKKDSPLSFSEETKKRVLEIARQLNYQPNYQARSLSIGKTECIGVAGGSLWFMDNPAVSQSYAGIGNTVQQNMYNMMFFPIGKENADPLLIKAVQSKMVDGLIVFVFSSMHESFNAKTLPALQEARIPVVALHSTTREFNCHHVGYDSPQAGYLAARHLLDQGMRKVGFVGVRNRIFNDEMYSGYQRAMQEAGCTERDLRFESMYYRDNAEHGYEFGKKLAAGDYPDGIVVHADTFAYGIMDAFKDAGKSIPGDMAVVGVDNVIKPELMRTGLTTVDRKFNERGKVAAETLFRAINDKEHKDIFSMLVEPELIVRGSSIK